MKGIEDRELNACCARLPLALRLEPGPPETGDGVPGVGVKPGGSGDSTGVV